jgi:hypothetical protein
MTIIARPHRVCLEHGTEFSTGLLDYTRGRSGPCVKNHTRCSCRGCKDAKASRARSLAITGLRRWPGNHVDFDISLAS